MRSSLLINTIIYIITHQRLSIYNDKLSNIISLATISRRSDILSSLLPQRVPVLHRVPKLEVCFQYMGQLIVDLLIVDILEPLEDLTSATAMNLLDHEIDLTPLILQGLS